MSAISRFLTSRWGPIITGVAVGILAPLLVFWGNPGNMGVCVVCFSRDIAGALGLHRAGVVQYIRPEIIGFVLGSLVAALIFREFKPRTGLGIICLRSGYSLGRSRPAPKAVGWVMPAVMVTLLVLSIVQPQFTR